LKVKRSRTELTASYSLFFFICVCQLFIKEYNEWMNEWMNEHVWSRLARTKMWKSLSVCHIGLPHIPYSVLERRRKFIFYGILLPTLVNGEVIPRWKGKGRDHWERFSCISSSKVDRRKWSLVNSTHIVQYISPAETRNFYCLSISWKSLFCL